MATNAQIDAWLEESKRKHHEARMRSKWHESKWEQLSHLRIEQVSAISGEFYAPNSCYANETLSDATWFVPLDNSLPVLTRKKDGTWGPRGF